jgi:hypothetical protein
MITQQIIDILEMLIPFKAGFTSSKGLKNKLKNIDLYGLLQKLKQPLAETVDENVTGETGHRQRMWRPVLISAGADMRRSPPLKVPEILADAGAALHLNALKIIAWSETLKQIADWDSPAGKAIRNYLDVFLDYHSRVLDEYLDAGDEANWRAFETRRVVEATLPPEKFAEVERHVRDLKERLGDSTTKRER